MLIAIFLVFSSMIISVLLGILSNLSATIPETFVTNVDSSWTTLLNYAGYWNGIFPVDTLISALSVYILFIIAYFTYNLALKVLSLFPFMGKLINLRERTITSEGQTVSSYGGSSISTGQYSKTASGSSRVKRKSITRIR